MSLVDSLVLPLISLRLVVLAAFTLLGRMLKLRNYLRLRLLCLIESPAFSGAFSILLLQYSLFDSSAPNGLDLNRESQSQLSAPPVWYSITRVSKKFFSFFRSMISDIHGNGLVVPGYSSFRPIWVRRRLAMNFR